MIYGILLLAIAGLILIIRNDSKKLGIAEEDKKIAEVENEAIANRPLSDTDLIDELRRKAADKSKDNSK